MNKITDLSAPAYRALPFARVTCRCPGTDQDPYRHRADPPCGTIRNAEEVARLLSVFCPCGHMVEAHRRSTEKEIGCTVGHSTVFPKPDVPPCECKAVFA